jgi:beta-lactamase class A
MGYKINRRAAFGLGTAAAVLATASPAQAQVQGDEVIEASPTTADRAARRVRQIYQSESAQAGGIWNSYVSVAGQPSVDDKSTEVVEAYSVNKVAVAMTVMDKIDRGLLTLDQTVQVPADIVVPGGDGIIILDKAYPSTFTLGHVLSLFLTVSDDTCVRLAGLVVPAAEINQIIRDKGFPNTQVVPVANPNRYFLGKTTAKETHDLLLGLVNGTLLTQASSEYLLGILRSPVAFTDGIRREMSSLDRARIATKAGWLNDGRNEAGIMFDTTGKAVLIYSLFAHGQEHPEDFGATHPVRQASAKLGPKFLRAVDRIAGAGTRTYRAPVYKQYNGG